MAILDTYDITNTCLKILQKSELNSRGDKQISSHFYNAKCHKHELLHQYNGKLDKNDNIYK